MLKILSQMFFKGNIQDIYQIYLLFIWVNRTEMLSEKHLLQSVINSNRSLWIY